jgi:hypothetical protein
MPTMSTRLLVDGGAVLVLSIPVVDALVMEHAAAVGLDRVAVRVEPDVAGPEPRRF